MKEDVVGESVASRRRDMVGQVSSLVEFLRALATMGSQPVRDVSTHPHVLWLADLPEETSLDITAASGDRLATFPAVAVEPSPPLPLVLQDWVDVSQLHDSSANVPRLVDPEVGEVVEGFASDPEVRREYARWSGAWRAWADADRRSAPARHWYEQLSGIHRQLSQQDDQFEVVLQSGLLSWRPEDGEDTSNHVLSTRLTLDVDAKTGAVAVVVADPPTTRLHDRELLDGLATFDGARAEPVRVEVRSGAELPLDDSVHELLEQWRALALPSCCAYEKGMDRPTEVDAVPALHFAPAIVMRPRGRASLLAYYDRMSEALQGPDAEAPLGLVQLLESMEPEERLEWLQSEGGSASSRGVSSDPLFPLPANDEQRQIIQRLARDTGVVVQGPPGTGKTHTIANLVSALVAEGQRVLVTSQKAQALSVLREKVPEDVRELCVSMTDQGRGGSAELSRSVNALVDRHGRYDAARYAARIAQLSGERASTQARHAQLMEDIRSLREAETFLHPEGSIAAGYSGTLAAIALKLREWAGVFDWLPVPLPESAPTMSPLDASAVGELVRLVASSSPERRARTAQVIPSVDDLVAPERVAALVATEQASRAAASAAESDFVDAMEPVDRATLSGLQQENDVVRVTLAGLARDGASAEWQRRCVDDALRGRNASLWQSVRQVSGRAEEMNAALDGFQLQRVTLPTFDASGSGSAAAQLAAGRALRVHVAGGGKMRDRGMFRSAVEKQAEPLLAAAVNDVSPSTLEQLDVVITQLAVELDAAALAERWTDVGHVVAAGPSVRFTVSELVDSHQALLRVTRALDTMSGIRSTLTAAGVSLALDSREEWTAFAEALPGVAARIDAREATAAIDVILSDVDRIVSVDRAAPECRDLLRALALRDVPGYSTAYTALADAAVEARSQARADELSREVGRHHPGLLALVESSASDAAWPSRLGDLAGAWSWAKAQTFFQQQRTPGREALLDRQLAEATAAIGALTGELAAEKAWDATMARMTARQSQALRAYQSATQSRGAGTGKYAHRYAAAAKEAMAEARGAVPAWIMPLSEVLETVPPDKNSFDVVIIDEASQASIETLYLLWLAPRVIVVGDDKQCAPSAVAMGELQPIFDKLDSYLSQLPQYLRVSLTPRDSLFSLLTTRFGSVVRLREHFRCMPEIIDWSSRQFYSDAPLVPLRQFGSDRLAPLQVRFVEGATSEGEGSKLRNPREAAAIAQQVASCIADPAYDAKTFGVVVLQGQAQVELIESELRKVVPPDVHEKRRLRVGTPPDFQGDERHVIMLSLVVGPNRKNTAQVLEELRRRYNVAASRAQDQMWLFHSVTADMLSPKDLRRLLLDHLTDPPAPRSTGDLGNVTSDEKHPAFDSLFEQRVFLAIRERGYQVTPQWEVNGRRIDLVVTGAKGRLAVECDGEAWHSTSEQVASDVHREQELKRAGWRFWRVRDSEFNWDPAVALEDLWVTLEARGIQPHEQTTDTVSHVGTVSSPVVVAHPDLMPASVEEAGEVESVFEAQRESLRPSFIHPSASPAEVRAWGRENGWQVGERGRLSPDLVRAYEGAHTPEDRRT